MKENGISYIKYLASQGLLPQALNDFRKCNMLYITNNYKPSNIDQFTTSMGYPQEWVSCVNRKVGLLSDVNIPIHIIYNGENEEFGSELLVLYVEPDEIDSLFDFKQGKCKAYAIYPEIDLAKTVIVDYVVVLGGVKCIKVEEDLEDKYIEKYLNV